MKKFSKTFDCNKIKKNYSFTASELSEKLGVTKGTIYSWIKEGLEPNDSITPYLFYGDEIRRFLKERQKKRKHKCKSHEMFCLKCQQPRRAKKGKTYIKPSKGNNYIITGNCEICNTKMNKSFNVENLDKIKESFNLNKIDNQHLVECNVSICIYNKNEVTNDCLF